MPQFKKRSIPPLQYIVNPKNCDYIHEVLLQVLKAGIDWVQLRMKDCSEQEMLNMTLEAQKLCKIFQATLIINDHVLLAKEIKADGVHLGKQDMSAEKAREKLGDNFFIGGTANTFKDIQTLAPFVNYFGLGPYKFTETKKNLSPVLGYDGFLNILTKCGKQGIYTPIVAIGGILPEDIPVLQGLGVYKYAVSSGIDTAENISDAVFSYQAKINYTESI